MEPRKLLDRISSDPDICHGKPCIKGTRIPVYLIVSLVAEGVSVPEIISDYPSWVELGSTNAGSGDAWIKVALWGNAVLEDDFVVTFSNFQATIFNNPPNQPSNTSPADGAIWVSLTPTLQSSAFSDPDAGDSHATSQWQITETSGDYSSPIFDSGEDTSNLTQITIPQGKLSHSTNYYWHVRHQDNHGAWSKYSSETSFTTKEDTEPPSVPELLSPGNGSTISDTTPTFDWSDVSDPSGVSYSLQVDNNPDFSSPEIYETGLTESTFTPEEELGKGTYYWRVKAVDGSGNSSDWTESWSFTIIKPGDANGDGKVDATDLALVATAFNTKPGSPNWNPTADLNKDGLVDIFDLVLVGRNFGKEKSL